MDDASGGAQGHGATGDSIVLEEEIDPDYVPTQVVLPTIQSCVLRLIRRNGPMLDANTYFFICAG